MPIDNIITRNGVTEIGLRSSFDLSILPPPQLIEEPTFEAIFDEMLEIFKKQEPEYTYFLASDPVVKLIQAIAYRELVWRATTNDRARASLLAFAVEGDLDHLGSFYGVTRQRVQEADATANPPVPEVWETDTRFRERIQLRLASWSSAGPAEHYRFFALTADPRVKDAAVYSPDFPNFLNTGGRVNVAVLSTEEGGNASFDVIRKVRERVTADDVRVVSDILTVESAIIQHVNVEAKVYLSRNAPFSVFENLAKKFREKFDRASGLGWDVTRNWLHSALRDTGVHDVEFGEPTESRRIAPNEFPFLDRLELTFAGFDHEDDFDVDELELQRLTGKMNDFYIRFATANRRTWEEIQEDLDKNDKAGVIQPTLEGLVKFLGIGQFLTDGGENRPADELAFAIHHVISKNYASDS